MDRLCSRTSQENVLFNLYKRFLIFFHKKRLLTFKSFSCTWTLYVFFFLSFSTVIGELKIIIAFITNVASFVLFQVGMNAGVKRR